MDDYDRYERPMPPEASRPSIWGALTRERRWRFLDSMEGALHVFGPAERFALYALAGLLGISTFVLVAGVSALVTVTTPSYGGTLLEGVVGSARFINPLLVLSQPDQDIAALVYSGLMRAKPDGSLVPDLAESYAISSDGRTYTFKMRKNAVFHDGVRVTASDVLFTVEGAVNPAINSPRRADWTGVSVSSPDDQTVVFTLPHAYAPFLQNTTLGILPKHLWEKIPPEEFPFSMLNTHPVGSGPYRINRVQSDSSGAASRYDLSAFKNYVLGMPYLKHISFIFYPDTDALIKGLNSHKIDAAAGISSPALSRIKRTDLYSIETPLPRVFGVFFNQSHNPVLAESGVRRALEAALDKNEIVQEVLGGRGRVLDGPIPPEMLKGASLALPHPLGTALRSSGEANAQFESSARSILTGSGWTYQEAQTGSASRTPGGIWTKSTGKSASPKTLSFTLATADNAELVATGKGLVAAWKKIGVQVDLQIYPLAELNTDVIRPRSYDALLFGEVEGPELDLYAFWHSSQRNDPGLNLALYANPKTDAILAQARATIDDGERAKLYEQFAALLASDNPAIFLYAPNFLYIVPSKLKGVALGSLSTPADRFQSVYEWYTDSQQVWKIFTPLETSRKEL